MNLFGTAGIRGDARERVTPELALSVGRAAARDAVERRDGDAVEFVVARDGRQTGPALAAAVEAGIASAGARVLRAGRLPTPALAYASRGRHGVAVTASHNPPMDNGLKLFADGTEYDGERERAVAERVDAGTRAAEWTRWTESERIAPLDAYVDAVAAYARQFGAPLDGQRVVVDCGNGVASLAAPQALRALGAEVVAMNANVDGHFPGRASKPTPESLRDLRAFVADGATLGVGHDGDADRVVVVDGGGEVVHEDTVVAILAEHYVRASDAGDPVVVTTPNASGRIDERVAAAGGRVERVRLGALHEGIARARADGGDETEVAFAAEPWKHIHPRFGPWIDGVASAAVFASLVADVGLAALRDPVSERPYRKESVTCPDGAKDAVMAELADALPAAFPDATASTDHGIRLERPDGSWLLVRPSGTEPYVRIYAEADDVDAVVERSRGIVEDAVAAATESA